MTRPPPLARTWAAVRATANTFGCLAVLAGFAWYLIRLAGWPLPDHWPTRNEWATAAADPLDGPLLRNLGACAGWATWTMLILAIAVEVLTRITRHRLPRVRLPQPFRALAAGLVGASIVGLLTGPAHAKPATTAGPPQRPPAATAPATTPSPPVAGSPAHAGAAKVTFIVRGHRYHVVVRRGDTMSKIARQWLDDADRWPEICKLNQHRHYPAVGGTLTDCDLIYPRWDLKLPADAQPPPGAVELRPAAPKPPAPPAGKNPGGTRAPSPTPTNVPAPTATTSPARSPDPDGVVTTETPGPAQSPPQPASPTATDTAPQAGGGSHPTFADDTWLSAALAAALLAAATLVVRRRLHWANRRRPAPGIGLDGRPMPYVATLARQIVHMRLRRHGRDEPGPDNADAPSDPAAQALEAFDAAETATTPAAIGLQGPGAAAAARAALVETLAVQHDGAAWGQVITTRDTLTEILDGHAVDTARWQQLHIADDLPQALDQLHAAILGQRRTLDTHAALPGGPPANPAPVMLIAQQPPADLVARLAALLTTSHDLQVSARLLGDWPLTRTVAADGTLADDHGRLPVLTVADTVDALALLCEAATGTLEPRQHRTEPEPSTEPQPQPAARPETAVPDASPRPWQKATLSVLGPVQFGPDRPGTRPHLRQKAKELAVYLACRPDGADVTTVCELLFPDSTVKRSLASVQQAASSLRKVLHHHTTYPANPLLLSADRYRINPQVVTVDLWQLFELTRAASATTDPDYRRQLLEQATQLGTGILGVELDNDWIEAHRVTATVTAVEAHVRLADDLAPTDPERANNLLETAITLDPANEGLYRRRMRLLANLNQADAIKATLRDLTRALADLDAQPEPETLALAQRLLSDQTNDPPSTSHQPAQQPAPATTRRG